jgi:integrase
LRVVAGVSAKALEFNILTAARAGETRGATWSEIDLDAATWTIPGERMKAGKLHRVPLSEPALQLLRELSRLDVEDGDEVLFKTVRGGTLSDMAMTATCRRLGGLCVPHGWRSTFRDWCAERTTYASELAEMALAHAIGNKVEAAYRRGDLFEKRRQLMNDWGNFIGKPVKKENVVSINARTDSLVAA